MARLAIGAAIGVMVGIVLGAACSIHADQDLPDETVAAASAAGVDAIDLQGAQNTTGLGAFDYLRAVGELPLTVSGAPSPGAAVVAEGRVSPPALGPGLAYLTSTYGPLGQRIWCVMGVESRWGRLMWNPRPWGRFGEHAQGWAGWLPSTWRTTPPGQRGGRIGDFYTEAEGLAWMIHTGRGHEFAAIASGKC